MSEEENMVEYGGRSPRYVWKTQLPVDYIDTSLTINAWENVSADLSGGDPARLWFIIVEQTNNGATVETIQLEITINGTAYTWEAAFDSATAQYGMITFSLVAGDFQPYLTSTANISIRGLNAYNGIPFTASTVGLIRVRQTTDVDATSAQIDVNIVWDKLEAV